MLPSASAKSVLFDEFVCSRMTSTYSSRFRAFVRLYDWISAFTGCHMMCTLCQRSPSRATIGPRCVKYAMNVRSCMPASVRYGIVIERVVIGRTSSPYR